MKKLLQDLDNATPVQFIFMLLLLAFIIRLIRQIIFDK